jgi:hypothetical protein
MTQPTEEVLRPCPSLETMRAYAEAAMQNGFRAAIDVAHGVPLSSAWGSDWFKRNPPESAIPEHEWLTRPSPDEATVERWRPIETAPKGDVLLYFPEERGGPDRRVHVLGQMIRVGRIGDAPRKPTHWMPLPEPPRAALTAISEEKP